MAKKNAAPRTKKLRVIKPTLDTLVLAQQKRGRTENLTNAGKGRKKGVPNKMTREVKEVIAKVFEDIGGIESFAAWARWEPTEFYKMYAKLLPIQLQGAGVDGAFQIVISKEESKL